MTLLLDTSGLLAAMFPDQNRHEECAAVLAEAEPPFLLTHFVVAELDYLILKYGGLQAELAFLEEIERGAYEIGDLGPDPYFTLRRMVMAYDDLKIGIADASIIMLASEVDCADVLALDERHFRAFMPFGDRPGFRILPADRHVPPYPPHPPLIRPGAKGGKRRRLRLA